jgi:Protein of unknown function (DUF1176)
VTGIKASEPDSDKTVEASLSEADFLCMATEALRESTAVVTSKRSRWVLSFDGFNAAMLKIDEVQGRLDTPGALMRKGAKAEESVPAAMPPPVVKRVKTPPTRPSDEALIDPILREAVVLADWSILGDVENPHKSIARLSSTQVLVFRQCFQGSYQSQSEVFIANDKPPYSPRPVLLPSPYGVQQQDDPDEPDLRNVVTEGDFENGILRSFEKGRGMGDCGEFMEWAWTGHGFSLTQASSERPCKGFYGGDLRMWVTRSVP